MGLHFASKTLDGGIGRHCVAELGGGKYNLLNDEEYICHALKEAATESGATFLGVTSHKFEPQGVTAVALLSESHISIHTWPEHGYAAIDAFTCGSHCDPEVAIKYLKHAFMFAHGNIDSFSRFMPAFCKKPKLAVVCS